MGIRVNYIARQPAVRIRLTDVTLVCFGLVTLNGGSGAQRASSHGGNAVLELLVWETIVPTVPGVDHHLLQTPSPKEEGRSALVIEERYCFLIAETPDPFELVVVPGMQPRWVN